MGGTGIVCDPDFTDDAGRLVSQQEDRLRWGMCLSWFQRVCKTLRGGCGLEFKELRKTGGCSDSRGGMTRFIGGTKHRRIRP
jgi:hypothetical protein